LAGDGEKITVVTSSRKNVGATGCGKGARWKSPKTDFPTSFGNPAKSAGSPLSQSPDDYWRVTNAEHFIGYEKGTLLMS
jgi:hypothetical protein